MSPSTKAPGSRQQAGYACEECRRRKARCDRVRPQCGLCAETGTMCVVVGKRSQKGARKNSLELRRARNVEMGMQAESEDLNLSCFDIESAALVSPLSNDILMDLEHTFQPAISGVPGDYGTQISGWPMPEPGFDTNTTVSSEAGLSSTWPSAQGTPSVMEHVKLSDLMWADLDQLYFDRVHPVCPMVHQWRYLDWSANEVVSPARACLRATMRTIAAAMSVQYRGFSDALYTEARRQLEESCQKPKDATWPMSHDVIPLEKIQAWLLLAHYQVLCMDEREAMLTAGRAMRLVQIARLYDVDAPDEVSSSISDSELDESFIELEEKRRTFWVAFTLDRFLCWRSEFPLTLQEETVSTRLPVSESSFQNGQRNSSSFLPQIVNEGAAVTLEPFAACIVMAAVHGRCLAHRRTSSKDCSKDPRGLWTRQKPLASTVERLILQLKQSRTSSATERDPMLMFAHMLAYSAVIHLSCTAQGMSFQTVEHQLMADGAEQRALRAVSEIVRLAKAIPSMWCLKAHPFLPNPLTSATTFLIVHPSPNDNGGEDGLKSIIRLLKDLSDINSLALEPLATAMTLTDRQAG